MDKLACFLTIFTPIFSTASVIIVMIALFTSDWIRTEEKIPNPNYNGTDDTRYLLKISKSGILDVCVQTPEEPEMTCKLIEYFGTGPYYPNPNDSTSAVSYAVRQSVFFFVVAVIIQIFGEIGYAYGHCTRDRKVFVFIGGTVFILSGLVMMIGIVTYISVFKTEVGNKLRPHSPTVPPMLTFQYGFSFVLYICGFLSVELSGTCAVLLFISEDQNIQLFHTAPIIYPENYNMISNPGVLHPCRKHPEVCIISGAPPLIPTYMYPTRHYERDVQEHYFYNRIDNSPPYTPANGSCAYEQGEWEYHNRIPEMQRTIGLQVDTLTNVEETISDYLPRDDFVPFNLEYISNINTISGTEHRPIRKTTVV